MAPCLASIQILDYSNSQAVAFNLGPAKIQTGTFRLIHVIDLESYENVINNLEAKINTKVNNDNPIYPFLNHEIYVLRNHIRRLKPKIRVKRSIDLIGKTWKWIAGNPDHDDLIILTDKINNILKNNNKQVVINKLALERINKNSNITNHVIKILKEGKIITDEIPLNIKFELEIIKEEIINIEYAMHWSKVGLINSFLLDEKEINIVNNIFERNNIPYINIEEVIEFSSLKIASSNSSIIYIIGIPVSENTLCNMFLIKPTKIKNIMNKINFEKIMNCNNKLYGIKKECNSINNINICNSNNIVELRDDDCITTLLRSQQPSCVKTTNLHIPSVEEISPGILFLNQYNGSITINNATRNITGTFVIHFSNITITVKGKNYLSQEISGLKPLPAILQPNSIHSTYEEILTLEILKEIHINNTQEIELLKKENKFGYVTGFSLSTVIIFAIIIIFVKIKCSTTRTSISTPISIPLPNISKIEETPTSTQLPLQLSTVEIPVSTKIISTSQIPYF